MVEALTALAATNYFALAESLRSKTVAIWDQILGILGFIDDLEQGGQPGREAFQKYARHLLQAQFQRLGWDPVSGEPESDAFLRPKIVAALGHFGDEAVNTQAKEHFAAFLNNPDTLAPDLRRRRLRIVGRNADQKTYDRLHEMGKKAKGTEERQLYYSAMCAAHDPRLALTTLNISLTDELVPEEATDLVVRVAEGEQKDPSGFCEPSFPSIARQT